MSCASRSVAFVVLALMAFGMVPLSAQSVVGKGKTGPVPDPVVLNNEGLFQAKFASVGDDMFIGGQPTEKALRDLRAKGVTTIVNLRMPEEMKKVGFDEAALAKELGIRYLHIPMRGTKENPTGRRSSTRLPPRWTRLTAKSSCTARSPGGRATSGRRT